LVLHTLSVNYVFDGVRVVGGLYNHHWDFEVFGEICSGVALNYIVFVLLYALRDREIFAAIVDERKQGFSRVSDDLHICQRGKVVDQKQPTVRNSVDLGLLRVFCQVISIKVSAHSPR